MRKGLTLIELLVVISILATLAALLFPVYLRVRSRVYAISCANQLRQIGLAMKMYMQDRGEEIPYAVPFLGRLYPNYVKDKNLLVCPYFQTLAPEVVEEMQQLYPTRSGGYPWSSYVEFSPWGLDELARKHPGEVVGYSEAFAIRGDQTPIVICEVHRKGCVDEGFPLMLGPKGTSFVKNYCSRWAYADPSAPIVILRWGGSVHLVYKGGLLFPTSAFLLEY